MNITYANSMLLPLLLFALLVSACSDKENETLIREQNIVATTDNKRISPRLTLADTKKQDILITGSGKTTTYKSASYFSALSPFTAVGQPTIYPYHTATYTQGIVALIGGQEFDGTANNSISFYLGDNTKVHAATDTLTTGRIGHTATVLDEGTLVLIGGSESRTQFERIDIQSNNSFGVTSISQALTQNRQFHTTTYYQENDSVGEHRVLVIGGQSMDAGHTILSSAELHNPLDGLIKNFEQIVPRIGHQSMYMPEQQSIIIIGGQTNTETATNKTAIFNTVTKEISDHIPLQVARTEHTVTCLPNGLLLIIGGKNETGSLAAIEVYDPITQTFTLQSDSLQFPRHGHTAIFRARPNDNDLIGDIFVYGGYSDESKEQVVQAFEKLTVNIIKE